MPEMISAQVASVLECDVGEGPFWDEIKQKLYFVDISNNEVKIFDPKTTNVETITFPQEVSAAILNQDSELIVTARDGIFATSSDGKFTEMLAPIEAQNPSIRTNDAKCDSSGRMWIGTMAFDFKAGAAALYSFESGILKKEISELTISNGMGWSLDQSKMYFIDSPTNRVDVFDYNIQTGEQTNRRPFITFEVPGPSPDGLTTDEDSGIWVAFFGGGQVRRFDASGDLTHIVSLPVKQVTSCCFGGADMDILYITTARYAMTQEALLNEPLAGSLFKVKTNFTGSKSNRYGGR